MDFSDAALRQWLADYLVTNIGCDPNEVDFDASMNDLGLGSRDSVVLAGELSELLGRPLSPVEFWQHPTINALASFLTGSGGEAGEEAATDARPDSLDEPIAVVGLGCRLPGDVFGPEDFWRFLHEGRSAVREVPPERWAQFGDGSPEAVAALSDTTRWGSFLTEIDAFDAGFFEISPREAVKMDPQQRLLLEVTHEALEHAGIPADSLRHTQTGVFAGACLGEYGYLASSDLSRVDAWSGTGGALSVIANRVSYYFDLRGPSITVDTACSSSLVAVHLACQSLRSGESNVAIAAGVNVLLSPAVTRSFDQADAMSQTGQCHAFDAGADGFVRGEGCGVAVLKRLSDALRDGDRVLAVVRGSAINQDGRSNGLMAPNPAAQMALLRASYANAGVEPRDVDYVEAHGTGTLLGDPIEARALGTVLGRGRPATSPLLIGAVKSNLGHLEAAAGITGFIKAVLSVQRARIPSNLHFESPNPHIPFENLRLKVVAEHTDWPDTDRPRLAGVSSFGFGGTNAHVVLEQAPDSLSDSGDIDPVTTLLISGKTAERIAPMAGALAKWMAGEGAGVPLADIAHTLDLRRTRHRQVAAVCARDGAQAVDGLTALAAGLSAPGVVDPHEGRRAPGTVFVYSGQGSQWAGMGRQLLADEPAFAAAIAALEPAFVEQVGFSLHGVLASGEPVVGIERIQPVLVGMQLALTELWRSHGVEPDAVIGHSMGEVTAAVVAGALTVSEGLRVIATRSRLMSRLAGRGAMALLELDAAGAESVIAGHPGVAVAVYASPTQTVIAGPPAEVDAVIATVADQGRLARRVEVDVASHHSTVDPILPELRSALSDLAPVEPRIPVISTVGRPNGIAPAFDADYWVANLREPVQFSQAVTVAAESNATFLEVSPHPLLTYAIGDTLPTTQSAGHYLVTSALKRVEDETLFFRAQLAALGVNAPGGGRLADVPTSPWLHSKFWFEIPSSARRAPDGHPLLGVHVELPSGRDHVWQTEIAPQITPGLADFQANGQSVVSTAVFAEMALAAGREVLGRPLETIRITGLEVEQPLVLDSSMRVTTQLAQRDNNIQGNGVQVEIYASSAGDDWRRHAVCSVGVADPESLDRVQVPDGPDTEIGLAEDAAEHPRLCVHPVVLEEALRTLAAAVPPESRADAETVYAPVSLGTVRVSGRVGRRARCRVELAGPEPEGGGRLGRIVLLDETGSPSAELTDVRLSPLDPSTLPSPLGQKIFDTEWVERPDTGEKAVTAAEGTWLLLADDDAETKALVSDLAVRLSSPARRVLTERLWDESAVVEAFAKASAEPGHPPAGVIVFVGRGSFDGTDPDGSVLRARELIWAIWVAARTAVETQGVTPPRLWLVTRDGLTVHGGEPGDPAIGALKGLVRTWRFPGEAARVLAGEPDLSATLVDLDSASDVVAALMSEFGTSELGASVSDDVIAWRQGRRYVERLCRATFDARRSGAEVRADGSYIVTGGLGGLGMAVTRWLVGRGAGRIVLNGRSEPSDAQRDALAELGDRAEIVFVAGDVASPGVAERLVAAAEETGKPLRGIVHAAGVSGDGPVSALTRDGMERVWAPKATGALRLHVAAASRDLDWWVGFSSMASLLGLPGQSAYATANAWLDALMSWRRASGMPATALNWGQWSSVGMSRSLTYSVLDAITPEEGIEAVESLTGGVLTRVGVARLRLDRAIATIPGFRDLGYFEGLVGELDASRVDSRPAAHDNRSVPAAPDWSQIANENRIGELETRLQGILARELRMSPSAVGVDIPFPELGLDSMMAMTILREAQQLMGISMSATMLWNHPTVSSLAAYLADLLEPQDVSQDDGIDPMFDSASGVLDALFESVESASTGSESGNR